MCSSLRSKCFFISGRESHLLKNAAIAEVSCRGIDAPGNDNVEHDKVSHVGIDAVSFGLLDGLDLFSTFQYDKVNVGQSILFYFSNNMFLRSTLVGISMLT